VFVEHKSPRADTIIYYLKGKGFPYSLPSVGPAADPGVQAVSPQTISHSPGGRLPLLSARPAVTFPATEHHRSMAVTKLHCLVTEAHRCEQLAQGCYAAFARVGFEPTTCCSQVQRSTRCATAGESETLQSNWTQFNTDHTARCCSPTGHSSTLTTLRGVGVVGDQHLLISTGLNQPPAHVVHVAQSPVRLDEHSAIMY